MPDAQHYSAGVDRHDAIERIDGIVGLPVRASSNASIQHNNVEAPGGRKRGGNHRRVALLGAHISSDRVKSCDTRGPGKGVG